MPSLHNDSALPLSYRRSFPPLRHHTSSSVSLQRRVLATPQASTPPLPHPPSTYHTYASQHVNIDPSCYLSSTATLLLQVSPFVRMWLIPPSRNYALAPWSTPLHPSSSHLSRRCRTACLPANRQLISYPPHAYVSCDFFHAHTVISTPSSTSSPLSPTPTFLRTSAVIQAALLSRASTRLRLLQFNQEFKSVRNDNEDSEGALGQILLHEDRALGMASGRAFPSVFQPPELQPLTTISQILFHPSTSRFTSHATLEVYNCSSIKAQKNTRKHTAHALPLVLSSPTAPGLLLFRDCTWRRSRWRPSVKTQLAAAALHNARCAGEERIGKTPTVSVLDRALVAFSFFSVYCLLHFSTASKTLIVALARLCAASPPPALGHT